MFMEVKMTSDRANFVVSLGMFASAIAESVGSTTQSYPVLGAEGNSFFIEIASGSEFKCRKIRKTIHVSFDDAGAPPLDEADADEVSVRLPDGSYLVALMSLLQKALKTEDAKILHPLNDYGDFLPSWSQAVNAAATGRLS